MARDDRSDQMQLEPVDGGLDERWARMIDRALKAQAPIADRYVERLRAKHPDESREQLLERVVGQFTTLLTATGAGIGGAAALPGIGTVTAMGLTVGEGISFAEACAFLTLCAASLYEVDIHDDDTRFLLLTSVLSGDRGAEIITKAMGKQGLQWNMVLGGGSSPATRMVLAQVRKYVQRKMLARGGGLMMGRLLPFGAGAVIGGIGNRMVARSVSEAVRDIFQHAPVVESGLREG